MDEMMCARSLFHAFFADNDGWHVTAIHRQSWRRSLRPSTDVNKRMHCVREAQFTTGPGRTRDDCKLGGWKPGLACSMCDIYQQAINTRAAPVHAFCCSQCSIHVRISKIDNGETRTRINFDNRLFDYRLKCVVQSNRQLCNFAAPSLDVFKGRVLETLPA